MDPPFGPVIEVAAVMDGFERPWFISGGWAIDLFVGEVTRDHEDVEIGGFFADQAAIRRHLAAWELFQPRDGVWLPLDREDEVRLPEFQIQARSAAEPPLQFDVFLNPRDRDEWVSRRHAGLRVPLVRLVRLTTGPGAPAGLPYLTPEVQLLYKAKYHRPKDDADFGVALPGLDPGQRSWLRAALEGHHPGDPWIAALDATAGPA